MRRRVLITIAATAALLLIAAVSLAAWLSMRETAESSFTAAAATVRVDLGDAETTPLFDLTGMEPGDTANVCFRAAIDAPDPATVAKLYSGGALGTGLADHLMISIRREDPDPAGTGPGIIDCSEFTGLTTLVLGETLADYASTTATFAAGDSLGTLTARRLNTVDIWISIVLPFSAPPEAGGLNATTSWIVEDQ